MMKSFLRSRMGTRARCQRSQIRLTDRWLGIQDLEPRLLLSGDAWGIHLEGEVKEWQSESGVESSSIFSNESASGPSVETDKPDYAPGANAIITARGFDPGSTLRFEIRDDPNDPGDDGDADVYAPIIVTDGSVDDLDGVVDGQVTTQWLVPAQIDPNVPADAFHATLLLDVTGSGGDQIWGTSDDQSASTTFTDAAPEANIGFSTDRVSESVAFLGGKVLNLDGTDDYVGLASGDATFDALSTITVEAWIKVDAFDTPWQTIISKGDQWAITRNDSSDFLSVTAASVFQVDGSINVNDGNWHHVALTYNFNVLSLYVDGQLDAQRTWSGTAIPILPTDAEAWIGGSGGFGGIGTGDPNNTGRYFEGMVDEVRIWDRARTAASIQQTMNAPLNGDESGLVAYYNFDDGTATDQTGGGSDGTLNGGATFVETEPISPIGYVEVVLDSAVTASPGVILNYEISSGSTAVQGEDFYSSQLDLVTVDDNSPTNSVFIAEGEDRARIYVSALPDAISENSETVIITLKADTDPFGNGMGYSVGSSSSATIKILDGKTHSPGIALANVFGENAQSVGLVSDTTGVAEGWVKLTSEPTANVTVNLSLSPANGSLSSPSLTFTPANWDQPQKISITGLSQWLDDDDNAESITSLSLTATGYTSVIGVNVLDDADRVKVIVDEGGETQILPPTVSVRRTGDAGEGQILPGVFTVSSDVAAPADGLRVRFKLDEGAGSVNSQYSVLATSFSGTTGYVDIPAGELSATILIDAVDDAIDDGNTLVGVDLVTDSAYTIDAANAGATLNVVNDDVSAIEMARLVNIASLDTNFETSVVVDDLFDVEITKFSRIATGASVTVSIALKQAPTTGVTLTASDSNGTASKALNFTTLNFATPQTAELSLARATDTGLDLTITTNANSDTTYGSLDIDLPFRQLGVPFDSETLITTSEKGDNFTFGVRLRSQPTANVSVALASTDNSEGSLNKTLTFTSSNWDTYQVATVVAQDDVLDDGDKTYSISVDATSNDGQFNGESTSFSVTNQDDDTDVQPGVSVANDAPIVASLSTVAHAGNVAGEGGNPGKFDIILSQAAPAGGITVRYILFEDTATLADVDVAAFYQRTGDFNPLSSDQIGTLSTTGTVSSLSFGDLDGDGDPDALLSLSNGTTKYLENMGTAQLPDFQINDTDNPLSGTADLGSAMGDVDGDGDLDVIQITSGGNAVIYFENQLDGGTLGFSQKTGTANPFGDLTLSNAVTPTLVDIDDDGELELFITGTGAGSTYYQPNSGGDYVAGSVNENPLDGVATGSNLGLNFADMDDDSDLDLVVGSGSGMQYFENVGLSTAADFVERTGALSPVDGITGTNQKPALVDLNGSGALDLFLGGVAGGTVDLRYFQSAQVQEAFIAGGQSSVTVDIPVIDDVIDEGSESLGVALVSQISQSTNVKATGAFASLDTTLTINVGAALDGGGNVGLQIDSGEQLDTYVLPAGTSLTFSGGATATVDADTIINNTSATQVAVTTAGSISAAETTNLSVTVGRVPLIVTDVDTENLALASGTVLAFSDGSQLTVTSAAVISQRDVADYNADGVIDSSDYGTWVTNFGTSGPIADGNGDGIVDAADYTIWANRNGTNASTFVTGILTSGTTIAKDSTAVVGNPGYRVAANLIVTAAFDGTNVGLKIDDTAFDSFTLAADQVLRFDNGASVTVDANTPLNGTTGVSVPVTLAEGSTVTSIAVSEGSSTGDFFTGVGLEITNIDGLLDGFLSLKVAQGSSPFTLVVGTELTFSNGSTTTIEKDEETRTEYVITDSASTLVAIDPVATSNPPVSSLSIGDTTDVAGSENVSSTILEFNDNDTAGVTVTSSGATTREDGTLQPTIDVVLQTQPKSTVLVYLGTNASEAVLSDSNQSEQSFVQLVFTPQNWNVAQTVTVDGVDDAIDDGDVPYDVRITVVSEDTEYTDDVVPIVPFQEFNPLIDDSSEFTIDDLIVRDTTVPEDTVLSFTNGAKIKVELQDTELDNSGFGTIAYSGIQGPNTISVNDVATVYDNFDRAVEVKTAYDSQSGTIGLQLSTDGPFREIDLVPGKKLTFSNGAEATINSSTSTITLRDDTVTSVAITLTSGSAIPVSEGAFFASTTINVTTSEVETTTENNGDITRKLFLRLQLASGGGTSRIRLADRNDSMYFSNGAVGSFVGAGLEITTSAPMAKKQILIQSGSDSITTSETAILRNANVVTADDRTNIDVTSALSGGVVGLRLAPGQGISSAMLLAGKELRFSNGTIATLDADVTLTPGSATNATVTLTQGTAISTSETTFFEENLVVTEAFDGAGSIEMRIDNDLIGSLTFLAGTDLEFSNGAVAKLGSDTTFTHTSDQAAGITIDPARLTSKGTAHFREDLVGDLSFTNIDDDGAGIKVFQTDAVVAVTEGYSNNFFSLVLTSEPTDPVEITLTPSDDNIRLQDEFMGEAVTVTFDADNWGVAQTIEVTAVDDTVLEYDHMSSVSFAVSTNDSVYSSTTVPNDVQVFIQDDELPTASVVTVAGAIEANAPGYFVVELDQPAPTGFDDTGILVSYTIGGTADADGMGTETEDVQPITGTARIAPGHTRSPLIAFPIDDFKAEGVDLKVTSSYDSSSDTTITLGIDVAPFTIGVGGYNSTNGTVQLQLDSRVAGTGETTILSQGTTLLFAGTTTATVTETIIVGEDTAVTVPITLSGAASDVVVGAKSYQQVPLPAGSELQFDGGSAVRVTQNALISNQTGTAVSAELAQGASAQLAADTTTTLPGESIVVTLDAGDDYQIGSANSAAMFILDNDKPGVRVVKSGTETTLIENDGQASLFVSLLSQPSSNVTITLDDIQTVRVLGVDQAYSAGLTSIGIEIKDTLADSLLLPAGTYSFGGKSVQVTTATTIYSDKVTSVDVTALASEIGATDTSDYTYSEFTFLNSSDSLTFTPDDWFRLQEVTIVAPDDNVVEVGDYHTTDLTFSLASTDPNYNNLDVTNETINVIDRRLDVTETYRSLSQGFLALEDSLNNVSLPIIGDFGSVAPPIISQFLEDVIKEIRTADNLTTDSLADAFTTVINDKIKVDQFSFEVTGIANDELTFLLTFADSESTKVELNSDLGLEALNIGIETNGDVTLGVDYEVSLGFGINTSSGFFLNTDETFFKVAAGLDISDDFSATGTLGFLQLDISDGVDPVDLVVTEAFAEDENDSTIGSLSLKIDTGGPDTFTLEAGTVIELEKDGDVTLVTVTSDTEIDKAGVSVDVENVSGTVAVSATGTVGDTEGSGIGASFVVTLEDDDGKLTLPELVGSRAGNPFDFISYGFSGEAVLDLDISTTVSGNSAFPSFSFNLQSNLPLFNYGNESDAGADDAPTLTVSSGGGFTNKAEGASTQLTLTTDGADARLTKGTQLTFTGNKRVIVAKTVTVTSSDTVVEVTVMDDGDAVDENVTIGNGATAALVTGKFDLQFNDITLDLGEFVTDLLGPIITSINGIVEPIRPVIDVLTSEIEILSEIGLADTFDQDDDGAATVIEVALTLAGGFTNGKTAAKFTKFVNAVSGVIELVDSLADLESSIAGGDNLAINFGSYQLQSFKGASASEDAGSVDASSGDTSNLSSDASSQTGNSGNSKVSKFFGSLDKLGISIDVLENPLSVIEFFLGQDIDLVTWDVPELDLGFTIQKSFPIFLGINGVLKGEFNVYSDLVFGFDTVGLRKWQETGFAAADSYLIFDGFYLSDVDPVTGEDVDELTLDATIAVGAELNAVVATVEALGGINGTAGLDLIDVGEFSGESDGKIRGSEVISRITRPLELFQIAGKVDAFLEIAVKVGINLGFWSIQTTVFEQELARVTLFEFSLGGGAPATASSGLTQSVAVVSSEPVDFEVSASMVAEEAPAPLVEEPLVALAEETPTSLVESLVTQSAVATSEPSLDVTAIHLGNGLIQYTFNANNNLGGNVYAQISAQGGPGAIVQVEAGDSGAIDFLTEANLADTSDTTYQSGGGKDSDSWWNDVAFGSAQQGPSFNGAVGGQVNSNLYQFSGGTTNLPLGVSSQTFLGQIVVQDLSLASLPIGPVIVGSEGKAQINIVNPDSDPLKNSLIAADGQTFSITGSYGVINQPPKVANPIEDIVVFEDAEDYILSLSSVFTDPEGDVLTYGFSTTNTGLFDLWLVPGGRFGFDFVENQYGFATVTFTATDTSGQSVSDTFNLTVNPVPDAPTITSPVLVEVAENQIFAVDVQTTDPDGETEGNGLTYALTGGTDQSLFTIDSNTGILTFNDAPDFENPGDSDGNNVYDLQVTVTDTTELMDVQEIAVAVTDINEAPTLEMSAVAFILPEDSTSQFVMAQITITDDALGTNILSLHGEDAALFEVVGTALLLRANSPLDFETNPQLDVIVQLDDPDVGTTPDAALELAFFVTDVNEAPDVQVDLADSVPLDENTDTSIPILVGAISIVDDALGTNTLSLSGTDASLFEIVGSNLFLKANTVLDFETKPFLDVIVAVDDTSIGTTPDAISPALIPITNVNESPFINTPIGDGITVVQDSANTVLDLSSVFGDPDGDALILSAISGDDSLVTASIIGTQLTLAYQPGQFGSTTISVNATDGSLFVNDTLVVTVLEDNDSDGVSSTVEDANPEGPDGNNDGLPDSTQSNVASLPSNTSEAQYVTLESSSGTSLDNVEATTNPSPADAPVGVSFPTGFFDYQLVGLALGVPATVTIHLPAGTNVNTFYKYGSEPDNPLTPADETIPHWYNFIYNGVTGAQFFDDDSNGDTDRIVLHFVDGQRGDDDLTANGVIVDPGAPAFNPNQAPTVADQNFEIAENETVVGQVTADDPDLPNDTLTYSIAGGDDSDKFEITSDGTLSFIAAPDYENPSDTNGDNVYEVDVQVTDTAGANSTATMTVAVTNQTAVISGLVFVDADGNDAFDGGSESAIDDVTVDLLMDAHVIDTDVTELGGVYAFEVDDEFGTYVIREHQPTGVDDGKALLGDAGGTILSPNEMQLTLNGDDASDYDFAETSQDLERGDTATIGFWQSWRGRSLIKKGGDDLVTWLNDNFGNIFGSSFSTAEEVARFYRTEFFKKKFRGFSFRHWFNASSKVDAQFMAAAFAAFFTSSNLAGDVAERYGFNVTDTGIGAKVVNVEDNGSAFGVADNTDMTILALLLATNSLTGADNDEDDNDYSLIYDTNGDGVIDSNERILRAMANDIYKDINRSGRYRLWWC